MPKYNILTLNANKMLASQTSKIVQDENNNWKALFQFDLSGKNLNGRDIILSEEPHDDNALFYQIRQCLNGYTEKSANNKDLLRQVIVFVDFKEVFEKSSLGNNTFDGYDSKTEKELKSDEGLGYRLRWIFDPANGIRLSFDGKIWNTFVPFDKSNSMSKECIISFVDKELKEQIDKRLLLEIDFPNIQVISSKYYAYRGLYLSTGYRIEQSVNPGTDFCLNHETVIVIPDKKNKIFGKVFTANKLKEVEKREDVPWFFSTKNFSNKITTFDGEGLICPEYAMLINKQLKENYNFTSKTHSFQIRMPFTKGMLHEVDYNKFFTEQLSALGKPFPDELLIEDCFHIKRDLRKAKIILTKSMFKCCDWLIKQLDLWKKATPGTFHDPMKYFFEKMTIYKHALYVVNTDSRMSSSGKVPLNYQFLSSLAISPTDFTQLINEHLKRIEDLPKSFEQKKAEVQQLLNELETSDTDLNSDDIEPVVEENLVSIRDKCLKALALNNGFLKDPQIKNILNDIQRGYEKNLCIGKLDVAGDQRFLSCDLLELLRYIYSRITNVKMSQKQLNQLRRQRLFSDHFYMPEKRLKMKADKYYGILRNPHLSRNEQCILRPYVRAGSLHDKYFSHLKGIVMLSCESLVPMALGGADFDGDIVKVISDKRIVKAIEKGGYDLEGKRPVKSLSVIRIPSLKADEETDLGSIPYKTVKNTFSSKVGQISNKAVKIARIEYGAGDSEKQIIDETKGVCCAGCTIVTGLEIDAAKTGVHPKKDITTILGVSSEKEDTEEKVDIFLDTKKALETKNFYNNLLRPYVKRVNDIDNEKKLEKNNGENKEPEELLLYLTKFGKEPKEDQKPCKPCKVTEHNIRGIPVFSEEQAIKHNIFNIDRLPGEYLKHLLSLQNAKAKKSKTVETTETTPKQKAILFKFETDKKWKSHLNKDKKETVQKLIVAYTKIRELIRKTKEVQSEAEKKNYLGYVNTLLNIQYDSLSQKLPCGTEVGEARNQAYATVQSVMENSIDAMKAIERLKKEKWHYTTPELRKHKINIILGIDEDRTEQLLPSVTELLSNFSNDGFMILFYILKDVESMLDENIDPETFIQKEKRKKEAEQTLLKDANSDTGKRRKQSTDFTAPEDNPFYEELYNTYATFNLRIHKGWHSEIAESCRWHMYNLFNGDMNTALQYVVAASSAAEDRQHKFLWNTFTSTEILQNVNELQ